MDSTSSGNAQPPAQPLVVPYWPQPVQTQTPIQTTPQPFQSYQPSLSETLPHSQQHVFPSPTSPRPRRRRSHTDPAAVIESAAFLTFFSILIFLEGGIRWLHTEDLDFAGIPRFLFQLFCIVEIVFSLLGLVPALCALLIRCQFKSFPSYVAIYLQLFFSSTTFILFNITYPVRRIIAQTSTFFGLPPQDSPSYFRAKTVLADLTAFQFSLALFAGQFLFMTRLFAASTSTKKNFWGAQTGNRLQAHIWNTNLLLAGLWTTGFGIAHKLSRQDYDFPFPDSFDAFVYPPHVGNISTLTIVVGIFMILFPVSGMTTIAYDRIRPLGYLCASFILTLLTYLNFTLIQFTTLLASGALSGLLTLNAMHVLALNILPLFYVCKHVASVGDNHQRQSTS